MENENIDRVDHLRDKYIHLSRYKQTPIGIKKIKVSTWICLYFSAISTGYFLHWGIVAPVLFLGLDLTKTNWAIMIWGFIIVWPVFFITVILGMAFSVSLYTSKYDRVAEKVHDRSERKSRKWYQFSIFYESSIDELWIRLTAVFGMIMISYGAIDNFNGILISQAEIASAQNDDLKKYENTAYIEDRIDHWTNKKINGKGDDDAQADSMLAYYNSQLRLFHYRADSLKSIVYNKAETKTLTSTVDPTASVKFVSKGNKYLYGIILMFLLAVIALANDGAAVRMTGIISRYDQATQAEKMYNKERRIMESLMSGNQDGNWAESGNGSTFQQKDDGEGDILKRDSSKLIIYTYVAQIKSGTFKSNRKLAKQLNVSHTTVNDVLNAWFEQQKNGDTNA